MNKYRRRYYWGKLIAVFGYCYKCRQALNWTRHGRGICPSCRKTY